MKRTSRNLLQMKVLCMVNLSVTHSHNTQSKVKKEKLILWNVPPIIITAKVIAAF